MTDAFYFLNLFISASPGLTAANLTLVLWTAYMDLIGPSPPFQDRLTYFLHAW